MGAIEGLRVNAVDLPHPARERRFRCLDEEVVVVSHQDVGMKPPAEEGDGSAQDGEKTFPVAVVAKDFPPDIAATSHVPHRFRVLKSKWPAHAFRIPLIMDLTLMAF